MRMLIVDDSRTMRSFLGALARNLAFETREAEDGQEALEPLADEGSFDIALVDWDMPRMNGLELVNEVRARPEFDSMKLMMVTAQCSMDAVTRALSDGADDYLMKPITAEMFEDKLRLLGVLE
jgi:two-component system, chemotaxis family, chemotaxis protein CheY